MVVHYETIKKTLGALCKGELVCCTNHYGNHLPGSSLLTLFCFMLLFCCNFVAL